jgi:hypothetical protein
MPTAWQLLMRKLNPEKPKSSKVQNPFFAKIGSSVLLDVMDYRDMTFFVKEIKEVNFLNTKNWFEILQGLTCLIALATDYTL